MSRSEPTVETTTLVSIVKTVQKSLKSVNKKTTLKNIPEPSNIHMNTDENLMTSISTVLSGLDFIFYVWTFLLVALVTYLSLKKYYQIQRNRILQQNNSQTAPSGFIPLVLRVLFRFTSCVISLIKYCLTSRSILISSLCSTGFWVHLIFGLGIQRASYSYLNNCLKWLYFNSEAVKKVNATIVKNLNVASNLPTVTYRGSTKRSSMVSLKHYLTLILNQLNCSFILFLFLDIFVRTR